MTYLVISDLHMTSGRDLVSGRWSPTEDFFWDEEFGEFLAYYSKRGPCTLIINGDMFDFLQVLVRPTSDEFAAYGIRKADMQPAYGLRCSEAASAFQADKIIDGHPAFFGALAVFLAGGHQVKIIKGNHDVQLFWESVRERVVSRLEAILPDSSRGGVRKNLQFLPWFFYVPGLLFVEHGNQYEDATSFRNFLNPLLPVDSPAKGPQVELDLASLLMRYFTNRMEVFNPSTDNIRPLLMYLQVFFRKHPLIFLSTSGTAGNYLWKAFRKSAEQARQRRRGVYRQIDEKNRERLHEEAERFSGGDGRKAEWLDRQLRALDAKKAAPALGLGPLRFFVKSFGSPLRLAAVLLPLYGITYIPDLMDWARVILRRWEPSAWAGAVNALLLLHVPQILIVALLILLAVRIRTWQVRHRKKGRSAQDITIILRRVAAQAAALMETRYVVYGHTHCEDLLVLKSGGRYFNTGTWIGIFSDRENLYRDIHQFTFLKIEDGEAELLRWEPQARSPRTVVVLDADPVSRR
jgi:UDP-2,3-diacylglucosamine pyrophosphatase LpxH